MATFEVLQDDTGIVSAIHGYHDIRIGHGSVNGVRVWSATTRDGNLGNGTAATRCGALWQYFLHSIGDTAEAKRIYSEAATAIQARYPEECPKEPTVSR